MSGHPVLVLYATEGQPGGVDFAVTEKPILAHWPEEFPERRIVIQVDLTHAEKMAIMLEYAKLPGFVEKMTAAMNEAPKH